MAVAGLVEEDSLEDVAVEVHVWWELGLVVCAVEAHFEFGDVLVVHFDVVHWFERLFCHFDTHALVDAVEDADGLVFVVKVFVVSAHVVGVVVGYGDVVGPFGGTEDVSLLPCAGTSQDTVCGVRPSIICQ